MSVKLVRCLEGHIFNLAESEVCPTCGAGVATSSRSGGRQETPPKPTPQPEPKPKRAPKPLPKIKWGLVAKAVGALAVVAMVWLFAARLFGESVVHQVQAIQPDAQTRAIATDLKLSNSALAALEVQLAYTAYRKGEYGTAKAKFERLAEAESSLGQYYLADIYTRGLGTKIKEGRAVRLLKKSAASGFVMAQLALGQRYEAGKGVPQDLERAQSYYLAAALQGNEMARQGAQRTGVDLMSSGMDVGALGAAYDRADYATAFPRAEELAKQGMSYGEYLYGLMHYLGYGTERDEETAVYWLRSGAEKAQGFAQWMMGRISAQGASGVEQNLAEAALWYRLALYSTNEGSARHTLKQEVAKFWPQAPQSAVVAIDALVPPIN